MVIFVTISFSIFNFSPDSHSDQNKVLTNNDTILELDVFSAVFIFVSLLIISGGKIDFAKFLDILHAHSQREQPYRDIMSAFRSHDRKRTGTIAAKELKSILLNMGEHLKKHEGKIIFMKLMYSDVL